MLAFCLRLCARRGAARQDTARSGRSARTLLREVLPELSVPVGEATSGRTLHSPGLLRKSPTQEFRVRPRLWQSPALARRCAKCRLQAPMRDQPGVCTHSGSVKGRMTS